MGSKSLQKRTDDNLEPAWDELAELSSKVMRILLFVIFKQASEKHRLVIL